MWSSAAVLVVVLSGAGLAWSGGRSFAAGTQVSMVDKDPDAMKWRFEPAEITVPVGSTVVWKNDGQQPHTVTADDNSFDSPNVSPGGTWQRTFAAAGDFAYHCSPHPWMKGVVRVTGAATPATAGQTATPPPGSAGSTTTTAAVIGPAGGGQASTTTSTGKGAVGPASTTTTGAGATTTTLAPSVTPTSAPQSATATTAASAAAPNPAAAASEAAAEHRRTSDTGKSSPVGIAFAAVSTLLLTAIAAKLLAAKT
jgi:plastocyanin